VAPADGVLTEHGSIDGDRLYQAKGRAYSLAELLGETGAAVAALHGGRYFTIYLAPHNYHRVHAPLAGRLTRTRYIPGTRFSVSRATAAVIPRLFCRNERAVCWFDTDRGTMAVVFVGALNVSSISTVTHGEIVSGAPQLWHEGPPLPVAQGAEIGRFNMGSTVIVLLGTSAFSFAAAAKDGLAVRMGQALGAFSAG
jgi:phosphatidylserine decarboxylase